MLQEGLKCKIQSRDWACGGRGRQTYKDEFVLGNDDFEVME